MNGNWHNVNGGGLPIRRPPPTVDEALPYSPFTSIIPFSPDIIPFPIAEPPTPSSTLSSDQQKAAKRAVAILNDEIEGQSTAQHLHETLNQLRNLLSRDKLPEYHFKSMPQLATPPPDSPVKNSNGDTSTYTPELSPFARMLLKQTEVSFTTSSTSMPTPPRKEQASARQQAHLQQARAGVQSPATANGIAHAQNTNLAYPPSTPSSAPSSTPVRPPVRPPGPAVMIKPTLGAREDYRYIENIPTPGGLSQKKDDSRSEGGVAVLRPHERDIADGKIELLKKIVADLIEDKDDLDGPLQFTKITSPDGEFNILKSRSMDNLSEKIAGVAALGRFGTLPVDLIMQIQSLLQPTVLSTIKNGLFPQEDATLELTESITSAKLALKASKLLLETMIEGHDDHRIRREEIIDTIVDLIKLVKDACIIPIVQARRSGESQELFNTASAVRQDLQTVLRLCGAVLARFATLIGKHKLSDRAVNALEYLTLELLVEQNSEHERDSVFTIKKFEHFRQKAMDVLAQVFAQHSDLRLSILSGIFSNLEKLPDKKASARQFVSAREPSIMTISALFMRFVQVVATNPSTRTTLQISNVDLAEDEVSDYEPGTSSSKKAKKGNHDSATAASAAQKLTATATNTAAFIAVQLCERASNTSKSGDKPFRNLLDLFIEDFCNVLGSPQWPAAVMLLQALLVRMSNILKDEEAAKHSVVDKDMALTTMARIGCGVIDFRDRLKKMKQRLDISQSDLSSRLDRLVNDAMSDDVKERVNDVDLYAFDGPYRMVIESLVDYLDLRPSQEDPHLAAVTGYYVSLWLTEVLKLFPKRDEDNRPQAIRTVQQCLENMIVDSKWLARKYNFQSVSDDQSKLAAGVITLQSQVCRYLPSIVTFMQRYAQDKHSSKLRTRGTTGLQQLLDKDPRVISENHVINMIPSLRDTSPMVREATLSLLSNCLAKEPSLERHVLPQILEMTTDPSNGPKKKAIKLLKDIYLRSTSKQNRLRIAAPLLLPSQDDESTISELSRNVLEEIWMTTASPSAKTDDSQDKLNRAQRASFMVDLVESIDRSRVHMEAFEKFFVHCLSPEAKHPAANLKICGELVVDLIDEVIDPGNGTDTESQARVMNALSVFAKTKPTLFKVVHLNHLKLYIKTIQDTGDIALVQPTVVIFRHVLPTLSSLEQSLADEIRQSLMRNLSKLASFAAQDRRASRETLLDVIHCLWAISGMPGMNADRIFVPLCSVICQLRPFLQCTQAEAAERRLSILSYLILLGTFGQVCSVDQHTAAFVARLRNTLSTQNVTLRTQMESLLNSKTPTPPSLLLLDTARPFTMQNWEIKIREQALRSMGGICQQSPQHFMRDEVQEVVKQVFKNDGNDSLKYIALSFIREFFSTAERRSETGAQIAVGKGAVTGSKRLESSFTATGNDRASLQLAQTFLEHFINAAFRNKNELAVIATDIIASISRQGLVHPKECCTALVALATSPMPRLAQVAGDEHKRIHEKQESYLEKEYMKAIRRAFEYQRDLYDDPHGMVEATHAPKLAKLLEALKSGKKASLKKFINNFCKQVDFDFEELDASGTMPGHVLYARFCLENLALLDFPHFEELAVFLNAVEAMVLNTTGPAVGLVIEDEMPKRYVNVESSFQPDMLQQQFAAGQMGGMMHLPPAVALSVPRLVPLSIADDRLRKITAACMILQMVWETRTFIRRCYTIKNNGPIPPKDYPKLASRNNFITGKDLWERFNPIMRALDTRESMIKQCYDFAELLDVDRDIFVDADGVDTLGTGYETPNDDGENGTPLPTSGRGRKRKSNVTLGNTPKKARSRASGSKKKGRNSKTPDGDEDSD
ncbi:sister chromatid cohesion protein mis4 [Pyrenophora teres f. maculata]|nr:sister chromatid cohesion protein mis4 [Pyrenophora teres f. maculata]